MWRVKSFLLLLYCQFLLLSLLTFAVYNWCSYIRWIYVNECYSFLYSSLYHYIMPFFAFLYGLCFKIYFVWCEYGYPCFLIVCIFLSCLFFIFSLLVCVCLSPWSESHIGSILQVLGFVLFFHSICHCVSFDWSISPLTFEVIMDRYVLIAI